MIMDLQAVLIGHLAIKGFVFLCVSFAFALHSTCVYLAFSLRSSFAFALHLHRIQLAIQKCKPNTEMQTCRCFAQGKHKNLAFLLRLGCVLLAFNRRNTVKCRENAVLTLHFTPLLFAVITLVTSELKYRCANGRCTNDSIRDTSSSDNGSKKV